MAKDITYTEVMEQKMRELEESESEMARQPGGLLSLSPTAPCI